MPAAGSPLFVRFAVHDEDAFGRLARVVRELAAEKIAETDRSEDDWKKLFSPSDLEAFWWPTPDEADEYSQFWFSTPIETRHSAEMPAPPWHFMSMIEAVLQGEYHLLGVQRDSHGKGVLEFEPHSFPYGGSGALRMLVRSFGHRIESFDDGSGHFTGDPLPPRWRSKRH